MNSLEYNNSRRDLVIPEYGRNVHKMVDYCMSVPEKEERNKIARAIISVMGQLFPYLRDIDDWNHKLWDHLYIISDFKLDVDSPYPLPEREVVLESKPDRVPYPQKKIKYGHYGRMVEDLIKKTAEYEDGEERTILVTLTANMMKKNYLNWNRNTVDDKLIRQQLKELSDGNIILDDSIELIDTNDVVITAPKQVRYVKKNNKGKKKFTKKRR